MEFLKKYYALLTGLLVFIVYLTTLAPSVVEIDSGELATVQILAGIAHPTGYPLFTILGHLFMLIPLPFTKIYQINLLAAFWCGGAVVVFTFTCKTILDNIHFFEKTANPKKTKELKKALKKKNAGIKEDIKLQISNRIEDKVKYPAAVLSGLILGFDKTFWNQGNAVEVYSLQAFLFCLIIIALLKAYITLPEEKSLTKRWLLFAAVLALGFTNHLTTLFVLPATAYLYFEKFRFQKTSFTRLIIMIFAVFLPILIIIYLYLPIRASQNPLLNWGNPVDFERFLRHVSGWQFHVWLFSSSEVMKKQLDYFFSNLTSEFSISLFICLFGIVISFIRARKFFIFNIVLFTFSLIYACNYDIKDIDSYFLLSYISLSFFGLFGIVWLLTNLRFKDYGRSIAEGVVLLFILMQLIFNYKDNNLSDVYTFEDYSKSVVGSTKPNSIILSYLWDYLISPSCYFQNVEHFRPDVTIIDKELLRRSWYYNQVNVQHPGIMKGINTEVGLFLETLKPFERNEFTKDDMRGNTLEDLYKRIMTGLVATNIDKHDFYISPELSENEMQTGQFVLPPGYTLVPDNLLFRVVKGKEYVPVPDPDFKIRFPQTRNRYIDFIENTAGAMLARRALYELQFNKPERARIYINKIKREFPDYILPSGLSEAVQK